VGKYLSGKRLENICLKSDENTMQFYDKPPIEDTKNRSEFPVEDIYNVDKILIVVVVVVVVVVVIVAVEVELEVLVVVTVAVLVVTAVVFLVQYSILATDMTGGCRCMGTECRRMLCIVL
jgi:Cu/Ag efflux pump CusA